MFKPLLKSAVLSLAISAALLNNAPVIAQDGTFTLNLKNADIHSLIQTVSRQSGKNFVVDPRVKARVTVISSTPLNSDELYETFLSVLQVHGYAAVPSGDLTKIVPDVNAKQGPVPEFSEDSRFSDQLVTKVIKVANVPAAQLVPILRPLVPQQGHLAAYASTNTLIVTDRASNIDRLTTIINGIDRPDNDEVEFVRLSHASASEIIRIITSLQSRGGQIDGTPGAVRFAADERTNSILLSGDPSARTRMRGIIMNLDTPVESGGNTRVIY
jgi:general secretion pathway protein D